MEQVAFVVLAAFGGFVCAGLTAYSVWICYKRRMYCIAHRREIHPMPSLTSLEKSLQVRASVAPTPSPAVETFKEMDVEEENKLWSRFTEGAESEGPPRAKPISPVHFNASPTSNSTPVSPKSRLRLPIFPGTPAPKFGTPDNSHEKYRVRE